VESADHVSAGAFASVTSPQGGLHNACHLPTRRAACPSLARLQLWLDLLFTIPFEYIILAAAGLWGVNNSTTQYISLLALLKLVGDKTRCAAAFGTERA